MHDYLWKVPIDRFNDLKLKDLGDTSSTFAMKWDPASFNWKTKSNWLIDNRKQFMHIWWDPKRFHWTRHGSYLIQTCPDLFHVWWDKKLFSKAQMEFLGIDLINHCSDKISIWWRDTYINEYHSFKALWYNYMGDFDIWWKPHQLKWTQSIIWFLVNERQHDFQTWYCGNKITSTIKWELISNNCQAHKHLWMGDYVTWKMINHV